MIKKLFNWLFGRSDKDDLVMRDEQGYLYCPNCGSKEWYDGPGGGSFGNIKCANCNREYNNLGPFGLEEIKR